MFFKTWKESMLCVVKPPVVSAWEHGIGSVEFLTPNPILRCNYFGDLFSVPYKIRYLHNSGIYILYGYEQLPTGVVVNFKVEYHQLPYITKTYEPPLNYTIGPGQIGYYENGSIGSKTYYDKYGRVHRPPELGPTYTSYFKTGKIKKEIYFKENKMHRVGSDKKIDINNPAVICYDPDGKIRSRSYYQHGRLIRV